MTPIRWLLAVACLAALAASAYVLLRPADIRSEEGARAALGGHAWTWQSAPTALTTGLIGAPPAAAEGLVSVVVFDPTAARCAYRTHALRAQLDGELVTGTVSVAGAGVAGFDVACTATVTRLRLTRNGRLQVRADDGSFAEADTTSVTQTPF